MFGWLREYLEIQTSFKERKKELAYCESCETLKTQLALVNQANRDLLDRILTPPTVEDKPVDVSNLIPITSKHTNWKVRQQMLEAEDRAKLRALEANKAVTTADLNHSKPLTVEDIEKELGVSESVSETETVKSNAS